MDERQIRAFAGAEAKAYGRGGIRAVSKATGLAINTVRRGIQELEIHSSGEPIAVPRRDNREESGVFDFTIIAGELGRGTAGV